MLRASHTNYFREYEIAIFRKLLLCALCYAGIGKAALTAGDPSWTLQDDHETTVEMAFETDASFESRTQADIDALAAEFMLFYNEMQSGFL